MRRARATSRRPVRVLDRVWGCAARGCLPRRLTLTAGNGGWQCFNAACCTSTGTRRWTSWTLGNGGCRPRVRFRAVLIARRGLVSAVRATSSTWWTTVTVRGLVVVSPRGVWRPTPARAGPGGRGVVAGPSARALWRVPCIVRGGSVTTRWPRRRLARTAICFVNFTLLLRRRRCFLARLVPCRHAPRKPVPRAPVKTHVSL